MDSAIKT